MERERYEPGCCSRTFSVLSNVRLVLRESDPNPDFTRDSCTHEAQYHSKISLLLLSRRQITPHSELLRGRKIPDNDALDRRRRPLIKQRFPPSSSLIKTLPLTPHHGDSCSSAATCTTSTTDARGNRIATKDISEWLLAVGSQQRHSLDAILPGNHGGE